MKLRVALAQMDVALADPGENRERARKMILEAAGHSPKPDVVILPEAWNSGYCLEEIRRHCDHEGQPTREMLPALARETGMNLLAGSVFDQRGGEVYNTSYIFDRSGREVASYSKVHLFGLMAEDKYIAPGNAACLFELEGVPCGMIICYDLRFPELARKLALAGAQILFVAAQWPQVRSYHWRTLNIARAIENQMYVVACNRVGAKGGDGPDREELFGGGSLVIGPRGEVLAEAGEEEALLFAEIDLEKVTEFRRQIPIFADRVPEVYK